MCTALNGEVLWVCFSRGSGRLVHQVITGLMEWMVLSCGLLLRNVLTKDICDPWLDHFNMLNTEYCFLYPKCYLKKKTLFSHLALVS